MDDEYDERHWEGVDRMDQDVSTAKNSQNLKLTICFSV